MSLTDSEIIELEQLLEERDISRLNKGLSVFNEKTNPNYKFIHSSIERQTYDENDEITDGYRGVALEGSSRSGKTWSGVDIILWLSLYKHKDKGVVINIVRETYAEHKETLYDDFKRRLNDFGLHNPFENAKEVKSFRIGKTKVNFLGCDKIGKKHGAGCDYLFFNEVMHIPQGTFDQLEMRCRIFWWADYNPSVTEHWFFNSVIPRNDVGFLRTTFQDNPFISRQERNKILSYEPWESGTYEVIGSEIFYKSLLVDEYNQPPPNIDNIEQGTADEFMWKVYGLGLRGAMKGQIFKHVTYIDEFPNIAHTWGLDFGFTNDPTALVKFAKEGNNIYLQLEIYKPIDTSSELSAALSAVGVSRYEPITADSSDKYVSEKKGTVQMVRELYDVGWEISKVSKTKGVMYWILKMKECKIHIVRNRLYKKAKKEQENYVFKEVNGILINQPEDNNNHFWDGSRYSFMNHDFNNFAVTTN